MPQILEDVLALCPHEVDNFSDAIRASAFVRHLLFILTMGVVAENRQDVTKSGDFVEDYQLKV